VHARGEQRRERTEKNLGESEKKKPLSFSRSSLFRHFSLYKKNTRLPLSEKPLRVCLVLWKTTGKDQAARKQKQAGKQKKTKQTEGQTRRQSCWFSFFS